MVPLSELQTRVRRRYEAESGGANTRFSNADIQRFINAGLETLAEETGFYERYVTIPVAGGRTYYDLRGFTPEIVVSIKSVWSTVRNEWLYPAKDGDLDSQWETAVGTPQEFWTEGINWLGVFPKASGTSGYFRVFFSGVPGPFTHPQAVLAELPDSYVTALEDYALYEMAAADRLPKRALLHWADYSRREKSLREFVDRRLASARAGVMGSLSGAPGYE